MSATAGPTPRPGPPRPYLYPAARADTRFVKSAARRFRCVQTCPIESTFPWVLFAVKWCGEIPRLNSLLKRASYTTLKSPRRATPTLQNGASASNASHAKSSSRCLARGLLLTAVAALSGASEPIAPSASSERASSGCWSLECP